MAKYRVILLVGLGVSAFGCPETPKPPPVPSKPASAPAKAPPPTAASAPAKAPAKAPPPTGAVDATAGRNLYLTACVNCHGMDGTGSAMRQAFPKIGNLTDPVMHDRMSDDDIAKLISEGRNKMPAFGGTLKPEQVKAIIGYVRSMKRQ